ncbi:hypothetical protein [Acanthopleuribacter pedis]|uniref:Uncharacterized protein n=1 Tax=Acanthopleuribacter pedis TaxID=442870 RepID=A0A8J7QKM1_9BACT|nr:hypothetical protein [Acanthopleuribacter pedis]MBO1321680.1 hypothetical protein [Acanthopleuribacter pedis]
MKQAQSRWSQVNSILEAVMDLPPEQAIKAIEKACGSDEGLQKEVLALWREMNSDEPEDLPMSRGVSRFFERTAAQDRKGNMAPEPVRKPERSEEATERRQWFMPFLPETQLRFS